MREGKHCSMGVSAGAEIRAGKVTILLPVEKYQQQGDCRDGSPAAHGPRSKDSGPEKGWRDLGAGPGAPAF